MLLNKKGNILLNLKILLSILFTMVKEGDTIVATEVIRLTRSTKQLCDLLEFAKEKHIKFILGSFAVDYTKNLDPMTEGMLKMMGVFSEFERNMISKRVKSWGYKLSIYADLVKIFCYINCNKKCYV